MGPNCSPKFYIKTLGCKVNQYDATSIKEFLEYNGFIYTQNVKDANYFIIQTCAVTMKSEMEARKYVRSIKYNYPEAKILITGCYAQRAPEELEKLKPDAIIGNLNPDKWKLIINTLNNNFNSINSYPDFTFFFQKSTLGKTRAFLKIHDGCNHKCSYCIIPYVRGKGQSLHPDIVISRLIKLINAGYKEIIITGINLSLYGDDINLNNGLYTLAKKINNLNDNFRVRFSSIEPSLKNISFFEEACNSNKIAQHFHLPLQHGCQKILYEMNRPYLLNECIELINFIHNKNSNACIGTDIITGYPTETNKDFLESYELIKNLPISYLHIFPYSPRPSTDAFNINNCSTNREISNRTHQLINLSKNKFYQYKTKFIGKQLQMLTFHYSKNDTLLCLSDNFIHSKMIHNNKNIPENTIIPAILKYSNNEFIALPLQPTLNIKENIK